MNKKINNRRSSDIDINDSHKTVESAYIKCIAEVESLILWFNDWRVAELFVGTDKNEIQDVNTETQDNKYVRKFKINNYHQPFPDVVRNKLLSIIDKFDILDNEASHARKESINIIQDLIACKKMHNLNDISKIIQELPTIDYSATIYKLISALNDQNLNLHGKLVAIPSTIIRAAIQDDYIIDMHNSIIRTLKKLKTTLESNMSDLNLHNSVSNITLGELGDKKYDSGEHNHHRLYN